MSIIQIFLLDKFNKTKAEFNIVKPKSYHDLLNLLKQNFVKDSKRLELLIIDKNNKEIKIDNEENYLMIKDILFIREKDKVGVEKSLFQKNFVKLSESRQDKLNDKFCCNICFTLIKKEKPYFCYICQKIFHEKCLKDWDTKCKSQNNNLMCPNCRNNLPIEKWKKKLDYEENRIDSANFMNRINEYRLI